MARRILLFITDLEIGGTPTVVRELATRLHHPPDVEIKVACLKSWGPVADQLRDAGIEVTALGATSSLHIRRAVRKLRELIRARSIDTVFSFLVHANTVAAKASRDLPMVRFLQSIQTTQPRPRWHWWVQRRIASAAKRIVVPSPSAAAVAQKRARVPAEKIVVIPNAVDIAHFSKVASERETVLARHHAADPATRVGFLGRLDPVKRVDDLIRAIKRLSGAQLNKYRLDVFGDGRMCEKLKSLARKELGQTNYEFHGAVESPGDAIKTMDILVLPSDAEGFGLVLIEAMAAGVPVVATNVAGIRDVITHQRTGLLVPPRSPDQLADAIRQITENRALCRRLVGSAMDEVRQKYSWETILPQYRRLLKIET